MPVLVIHTVCGKLAMLSVGNKLPGLASPEAALLLPHRPQMQNCCFAVWQGQSLPGALGPASCPSEHWWP
jgi:hypothetical protein